MLTIETCPLCRGRGTNRRAAARYRPSRSNRRDRCPACRGDGCIALRRLQQIMRRVAVSPGRLGEPGGTRSDDRLGMARPALDLSETVLKLSRGHE